MTKPVNNMLAKTSRAMRFVPQAVKRTVLTQTLGRVVPYLNTSGVQFETLEPLKVEVSLKNTRAVQNHIGQVHAVAMVLLAETSTGFVVGINLPNDKICLIKTADISYRRPSQGNMRAVASLTEEQASQIQQLEEGEVLVNCQVFDESGKEPMQANMTWAWISKAKLAAKRKG